MSHSPSPRDRRFQQFLRAIVSASVARPVALVCMLVQTPVVLRALDSEGFGFWLTLTSLFYTFLIADLGLSLSMQNRVSYCLGQDDLESARRIFLHTLRLLAILGAAFFVSFAPVIAWLDWNAIFHLTGSAETSQSRACLLVTATCFCINLPLLTSQRLAVGLQLSWVASIATLAGNVGSLAMVFLAATLRLPLVWFVALTFLPLLASNVGLLVYLFQRLKWSPRFIRPTHEVGGLVQNSFLFFLPQLGAVLVFSCPSLLIAILAGADAVTPFALGLRATSLLSQTAGLLLTPLWPAYAEALARCDYAWIRMVYRGSALATVLSAGLVSLALGLGGQSLIRLWVQSDNNLPSSTLMTLLATWTFLTCIGHCHACLLNGLGRLKGQATYGFSSAVTSVVLIFWLVPIYGATGAAAALLLGFAIINCPGFLIETALLFQKLPAARATT